MGETIDDLMNLIICDVLYSIFEQSKNPNILLRFTMLAESINSNNLGQRDCEIVEIVIKHLNQIFGLTFKDGNAQIFNFLTQKKVYSDNLNMISFLRKNGITLVTMN